MHSAATADLTVTVVYLRLFFFRLRTLRVTYRSMRKTWLTCGNSALTWSGASITWMVRRLGAPVPGPGGLVADRDGGPVQGIQGGEELRRVAFDGHDVVRSSVLRQMQLGVRARRYGPRRSVIDAPGEADAGGQAAQQRRELPGTSLVLGPIIRSAITTAG